MAVKEQKLKLKKEDFMTYDPKKVTLMGPDLSGKFVLSDANDNCITIVKCNKDCVPAAGLFGARVRLTDDKHEVNAAFDYLLGKIGTQITKPTDITLWFADTNSFKSVPVEDDKEPTEVQSFRFEASYMQADARYRNGLWKVEDSEKDFRSIAHGPKGKMQQLTKLLNSKEVYFEL